LKFNLIFFKYKKRIGNTELKHGGTLKTLKYDTDTKIENNFREKAHD